MTDIIQITGFKEILNQMFNIDVLEYCCTADEENFKKIKGVVGTTIMGRAGSEAIYVDNGSNILGVAHLDKSIASKDRKIFECFKGYMVGEENNPAREYFTAVTNGNLDDRLGVYILLYHLPELLGVKFDWLLTTNEEVGWSTADEFECPAHKNYNWIIEFDRRGTDVVLYQYETLELNEIISKYATVGSGSWSDISLLDRMGVKAINWGVGYYSEHTPEHFANLDHTALMIHRFVAFYNDYKNTRLEHKYAAVPTQSRYNRWNDYDYATRSSDYSATSKQCSRCNNMTFSLHWDDYLNMSVPLCNTCYNKYYNVPKTKEDDKRRGTSKQHPMTCVRCSKVFATLFMNDDSEEVCYNCLNDLTIFKCETCFKAVDRVFLLKGTHVCVECLEHYVSLGEKEKSNGSTTATTETTASATTGSSTSG